MAPRGFDAPLRTHTWQPGEPAREDEKNAASRKASRLLGASIMVKAVRLRLGQGSLGHPCNSAIRSTADNNSPTTSQTQECTPANCAACCSRHCPARYCSSDDGHHATTTQGWRFKANVRSRAALRRRILVGVACWRLAVRRVLLIVLVCGIVGLRI